MTNKFDNRNILRDIARNEIVNKCIDKTTGKVDINKATAIASVFGYNSTQDLRDISNYAWELDRKNKCK